MKNRVEIERNNVTPKEFWSYCRREVKRRTGMSLEDWCESYEAWSEPTQEAYDKWHHEDWNIPVMEVCKITPYNWQLFLGHQYNFIMEFDFWDFRSGYGYLYLLDMNIKNNA